MTALDYILAGAERVLEIEREHGVAACVCDRKLLAEISSRASAAAAPVSPPASVPSAPLAPEAVTPEASVRAFPFVYLHDRRLTPKGTEMMHKITTALNSTDSDSPTIVTGDLPEARIYVALGSRALERWFPTLRGVNGQWLVGPKGESVLVVESPENIVRYDKVTPAVQAMKQKMWTALKQMAARLSSNG